MDHILVSLGNGLDKLSLSIGLQLLIIEGINIHLYNLRRTSPPETIGHSSRTAGQSDKQNPSDLILQETMMESINRDTTGRPGLIPSAFGRRQVDLTDRVYTEYEISPDHRNRYYKSTVVSAGKTTATNIPVGPRLLTS